MKTTKTVVEGFFEAMYAQKGWEEFIADDVTFEGPLMAPVKGKEAFIEVTKQFLQNQNEAKVRNIIVQEDSACVMTNYKMGHPAMAILDLDACEIVQLKDGKVTSMEIYFDSQKLTEFMAKMKH